jgi:orotate phosphoribosyltransferase
MINNSKAAEQLADYLLQINAIKLNPQTPFTWASGWKSPIYCDNRLTLSYPIVRQFIKEQFKTAMLEHFADAQAIAGVATAGIPHGALLADLMGLPFLYVRSAPKQHGLTNMIEGKLNAGDKIVVIEDLISTGKSSLEVVAALKNAGANVQGMMAIFTYGFTKADDAFANANCKLVTLSDYHHLIQLAAQKNYIQANQIDTLQQWRTSPDTWTGIAE